MKNHQYIRRFIYLLALLLVSFYTNATAIRSIEINYPDQLKLIGKQTQFLEDTSGILTISDIQSEIFQSQFQNQEKDVFNRPATRSAFWYKIIVENNCSADAWLEVSSTYAWYIDFYWPDSSGNYNNVIKTGTMRPKANKAYDVNLFWLPLNKAYNSDPITYYVRIESGLTYELPLHVGTISSLSKNKDLNDYLTAGFIGLMLIMFLYNAFIYFSTFDKIYLYYIAYIFLMAISMPYANGYPFIQEIDFWFFDKQWWNNKFLLWHPPVYFFIGAFCIRYLDLTKNGPIFKRIIQAELLVIVGFFPLLTLLGVEFVDLVNTIQVLILLLYLTCLFTGYYFAIKKVRSAYYYILGWTFMVAGAFVFFAVVNGVIPYNPISRNALYFGVALEVWMFSLALGNRLNILSKENEQVQLENFKLINEQKEILEINVKERTEELILKNRELKLRNKELKQTTTKLDLKSQQLEELNSTKDKLFAIVSHDLRSPLITLKNLLYLIDDESIDAKKFQEFSSKLKNDVEHLHFTLNNLLQWAISQMKGLKANLKPTKVFPLVQENIKLLSEFANTKQVNIKNEIPKSAEVFADSDFVRIIIRNLIYNALKFTHNGGLVRIISEEKNGFLEIAVVDSGIGMSPGLLKNLFKNKSSNSSVGTEGEKGTGLGLMLCQEFVERIGGKIWAESVEGEGSSFYFTLPIND